MNGLLYYSDSEPDRVSDWKKRDEERRKELEERRKKEQAEEILKYREREKEEDEQRKKDKEKGKSSGENSSDEGVDDHPLKKSKKPPPPPIPAPSDSDSGPEVTSMEDCKEGTFACFRIDLLNIVFFLHSGESICKAFRQPEERENKEREGSW